MSTSLPLPTCLTAVRKILEDAIRGEQSALPYIQDLLEHHPDQTIKILAADLVTQNEELLVEQITNNNPNRGHVITHQLEQLKAGLVNPQATPLERLLTDRIAICWLQVQQADLDCLHHTDSPHSVVKLKQQIRDRAHRRLISAIKALAQVQKLNLPNIQVNIAENQVNVTQQTAHP